MWLWQLDWTKFDGATLSIIFATLAGPILAVQAQKYLERWNERKRDQSSVFAALMNTRSTSLSDEHVHALNRIQLAFHKNKSLMTAWTAYLDNLAESVNEQNSAIVLNNRQELFNTLLFQISTHLGYSFTKTDIKNTCYRPTFHVNLENTNLEILAGLKKILSGEQSLPIHLVVPEDVFVAQGVIVKWIKDVAEGKDGIPLKSFPNNKPGEIVGKS